MKKIVLVIVLLLCLLEILVMVIYFKIFNGPISLNSQDWGIFSQVFNGCIMAALTGINIWIFYKISNSIEENTRNRAVKQILFEAQLVITQMRVKQYDEISLLVNEIKVDLFRGKMNEDAIEQFKKKLMKIDQSFLFKNDNLEDSCFLFSLSKEVLELIAERKEGYMDELLQKMTNLVATMEIYTVSQMLRDRDVMEYMNNHKGYIDSTFSCIDQFANKFSEFANKSSSNQ